VTGHSSAHALRRDGSINYVHVNARNAAYTPRRQQTGAPRTSEWKLARFGNVQSRVFQKPELEEKLEAEMAAMPDLSDP
jgi:hypothetical protein